MVVCEQRAPSSDTVNLAVREGAFVKRGLLPYVPDIAGALSACCAPPPSSGSAWRPGSSAAASAGPVVGGRVRAVPRAAPEQPLAALAQLGLRLVDGLLGAARHCPRAEDQPLDGIIGPILRELQISQSYSNTYA
jgi:hypothetical protein